MRGPAPGKNRVRARLGKGTNKGRDLPGAAARLARRRRGFSPGRREQELGSCLPGKTGAVRGHAPGNNRGRVRLGEKRGRANRFAGGRRTTGCIAGDKAACADSPAPGRRVRELPAAGGL